MSSINRLVLACAFGFNAAIAFAQAGNEPPCEAYSESASVFIGVAGAPVKRWVQLPDQPLLELKLTPVKVERAFLGATAPMMYLTPRGIEQYATPGQRYLVYGRDYGVPDIVMASPGFGVKDADTAAEDIAFLDALAPVPSDGTIIGVVRLKARSYGGSDGRDDPARPLERIALRVFDETHSFETVSGSDGKFVVSGLPPGTYQVSPQLPQDLVVWDPTSRVQAVVRAGGCATIPIDVSFNGRVRGVLRGSDGLPLRSTSVDLVPMDVEPDAATGHIAGMGSVSTDDRGEFEFMGRPAGRYYLGVSLYNAPNPSGPSYPRTYYPGTTDRASALPVIVQQGQQSDNFDFSVPATLAKGTLEYVVETDRAGALRFCFVQLEDQSKRWSSDGVERGVVYSRVVVDGQRYQVHVHLALPGGGHLESEPFVFTATPGKTIVTLRPDAPRELHR